MWARVATLAPERGLVASSASGTFQLHPWDVESGLLEPITSYPSGKMFGVISPDGRWIVWHEDTAGDERGHVVTGPWPSGERR
jgi:hypothetical protein